MTKQVVIFDMDGTMIDTEYPYYVALQQACDEYKLPLSEEEYFATFAGSTVANNEALIKQKAGSEAKGQQVLDRALAIYQKGVEKDGVPMKPTLIETLDALEEKGLRLLVASSSVEEEVKRQLSGIDILDRFEGIVAGDHISHPKPHPEIFLQALDQAHVRPNQAFIVEDSFQGVEAGYRAGVETIMVPDYKQPTPEVAAMAYAVVPKLVDILPFFE